MRRWLLAGGAVILLAIGGWLGWTQYQRSTADPLVAIKPAGTTALDDAQPLTNIVTVDVPSDPDVVRGATPMAERVAVVGLLNKRSGVARDLTLKPGKGVRVGDVMVRLRACEQTAPWEPEHYTGAFVQVDVREVDRNWRRVFSGWLFKERPGLNVVLHPIYDVWVKSCAMTFPSAGPDTVVLPSAPSRSSAKKSAEAPATGADAAPGPAPAPTAPSTAPAIASDKSPT